jgi:N-acetyl-gamma-glutamyl-phosphate reductase
MSKGISIGIVGGAGYTGGELIRVLLHHPLCQIKCIHSKSHSGKPIYEVHQDLIGTTELKFTNALFDELDVLFLCLGHGESTQFLTEYPINNKTRVIDLANDFRLTEHANFQDRNFIYGLPELNMDQIREAHAIANPGCFATAIQLGLLPLAKEGMLGEVYTTAITGSTGAGQSLSSTSHFSWRANNIQAYKTLTHQHLDEIHQSLNSSHNNNKAEINFVPWRGDFTRGIFSSSTLNSDLHLQSLVELFKSFYEDHPFVSVSEAPISLKAVVNTNRCLIQLEKIGSKLVVHAAIDNLLKGASGQAVQNMNIMFGFDQQTGLNLKPSAF